MQKTLKIIVFVGFVILLLTPIINNPAMAADSGVKLLETSAKNTINNNSGISTKTFPQFAGQAAQAILGMVGALFIIIFIYGGFVWTTASGDPAKLGKAKTIIVAAIIGLIITMSSYVLATFVLESLGQGEPDTSTDNETETGQPGDDNNIEVEHSPPTDYETSGWQTPKMLREELSQKLNLLKEYSNQGDTTGVELIQRDIAEIQKQMDEMGILTR